MKVIICIVCGDEFNPHSPAKIKAGGKINQCPDCSEETEVKYFGLPSADGKMSQISILKTETEEDKQRYIEFWKNNSGLYKGKNCQLGSHLTTDPKIKFSTRQGFTPTNHKGKA